MQFDPFFTTINITNNISSSIVENSRLKTLETKYLRTIRLAVSVWSCPIREPKVITPQHTSNWTEYQHETVECRAYQITAVHATACVSHYFGSNCQITLFRIKSLIMYYILYYIYDCGVTPSYACYCCKTIPWSKPNGKLRFFKIVTIIT